jgi:hypothetical protein
MRRPASVPANAPTINQTMISPTVMNSFLPLTHGPALMIVEIEPRDYWTLVLQDGSDPSAGGKIVFQPFLHSHDLFNGLSRE